MFDYVTLGVIFLMFALTLGTFHNWITNTTKRDTYEHLLETYKNGLVTRTEFRVFMGMPLHPNDVPRESSSINPEMGNPFIDTSNLADRISKDFGKGARL